jgi:hypothetical protein
VNVTDLCNAAISHVGTRSKISSIDEGSPEASACQTHFPFVRDATLRAYDWNFARLTVSLAQVTCSVKRWQYEFVLPSDLLRLRRLNDVPVSQGPQAWFEVAADKDSNGNSINVVLCNNPTISAIYTARVLDPSRWDQGFIDAVTYGLAARICYEITGKSDRTRELAQMWQSWLSQAAAEMLNENPDPMPSYTPEMLQARGYDDGLSSTGQAWSDWCP